MKVQIKTDKVHYHILKPFLEREGIELSDEPDIIITDSLDDYNVPFIVLSNELDKVQCYLNGAVGYVEKPINVAEVVGLTIAQLNINNVTYKDLTINRRKHIATVNNKPLELSEREYSLLLYLVENQGTVVSKKEIGKNVWNIDFDTKTNYINVYISYLRKKLPKGYITTIRNEGYIMQS
ncbi:MAG TPA: response regulator transcription factor [Bacteroidales bacterium]|nr:response regulator transcription factor [Bacteroidales bacterium]